MKWSRKIEQTLLIMGSLFVLAYGSARIHRLVMSRAGLWSFWAHESHSSASNQANEQPEGVGVDVTLWSESRFGAYIVALGMKLEPPLAVLSIPRIRVEVPVFDGTDELILNRGAGRILGTARPGESGNIGIAAHRDGFFRSLKDIQVGDRVELAAREDRFVYTVDNIEIVKPTDVEVLRARPHPSLTLVTCYPFYFVGDAPQRYVVHASRVDSGKVSASALSSAIQNTTKNNER